MRKFVQDLFSKLRFRSARPSLRTTVENLERKQTALHDSFNLLLQSLSTQNAALREARRYQVKTEHQFATLEQRLDEERRDREAITLDLAQRVEPIGVRLDEVQARAEFIRREIMFEFNSRQSVIRSPRSELVAPKIIDEQKLAAGNLRVNLGCGHLPIPGFINVDGRDIPGVDIVADVRDMPFERDSLEQIHSAHMLEHFPLEELRRVLLPYWVSLLKPGGRFTAIVPDAEAMIRAFTVGQMTFDELREVTFGLQEYMGDQHYTMFSQASLCGILDEAGLPNAKILASGRRNGVCFEMEIEAFRPLPEQAGLAEAGIFVVEQ